MAYQPKSYRKFLAGTVTAAVVASAVAPAASAAFTDVSANDTHAINVNKAVSMGLINGYPDGTFGTYQDITRGQVAKIIARYLGNVDTTGTEQFTDVANSPDTELKAAALKVRAAGVFTGSNGALNAGKNITRQEMASVVARLFELTDIEGVESKVTDNDKAWEVHRENINLLSEYGITTEASFNPLANVKRGQFASFIVRAIELAQEVKIEKVTALDTTGRYVEINFSKPVVGLEASDISITETKSGARKGVKDVKLSSNGKTATVELFAAEDGAIILKTLTDYTVKVYVNGETLTTTFNRPAFVDNRIVDVDHNDSEFTVAGVTVTVPKGKEFDYADALGRDARVWYNKDRELVNIVFEDEEVVEGAIEVTKAISSNEDGEIEVSGGDKYSLAKDFEFYLNDSKTTLGAKATEYDYAKVLFDKNGKVELVIAYNWDDFLVVNSVDGDVAIAADKSELDLEDVLVFKDGKQISASDIKKGDIIFFNDDANEEDGVAEVFNSTVTGEIDDVFSEYIRVDGKDYKYVSVNYGKKTQYLDGDKFKDLTDKVAEEFQAGGEVTLFLDRDGNVVYITGAQEDVNSNTIGFHSTEAAVYYLDNNIADRGNIELEGLNGKGEEKLYTFRVNTLDQITDEDENEFEVDENFPNVNNMTSGFTNTEIDKFALRATGEVVAVAENGQYIQANGTTTATIANAYTIIDLDLVAGDNSFFEIKTNDSNQVKELTFFKSDDTLNTGSKLKLDDKYVNGYKLLSDTVVFDGAEGWDSSKSAGQEYDPDADEINVTTWGDLKGKGFDISKATYYYNSDNEVEYLVIQDSDAEDTTLYNGVVTKVVRNTSNEIVEIKAFVDGKESTYKVDKVKDSTIAKGKTVVLEINDDNGVVKTVAVDEDVKDGVVAANGVDVANRTITIGSTSYKIAADADVYDYTGSDVKTEQLRNIKAGDTVTLVYAPGTSNFVDTILITNKVTSGPVTPTGLVSVDTTALTEGFGTKDVIITSTSGAFAAGAESLVTVTGLPGTYGAVTRVNNTTLKFTITEAADFDSDQTATINVPASALTATGATNQTKEIAFTAVDEVFTLTAGKLVGTPALGTLSNGGAVEITDGAEKTVDEFKAKLTAKPATFGADDKVSFAIAADGTLSATITDGPALAGTTNGDYEVQITGTGKYAGKTITVKFTVTSDTTVGTITLK